MISLPTCSAGIFVNNNSQKGSVMNFIKLFFLVLGLNFQSAQAAEVCLKINDNVQYKSAFANFDGSITVIEPKLTVGGKPLALHQDLASNITPASDYCKMMGKELVQYGTQVNRHRQNVVKMADGGLISEIIELKGKEPEHYITRIICR